MLRRIGTVALGILATLGVALPAFACGGLLSPNGSVNLVRTTTLAAYHGGLEHYVTSFRFVGGGGAKFGSIVPLPGVPTDVSKAGDWTLQRLLREVQPPVAGAAFAFAAADSARSAQVILEKRIDALDVTVLKGGGDEVARWATDNGFELSPDAPEVLDFYARRSPIFLAARFDAAAARDQGLNEGDGTPIHVTIATPQPWVPLRILALGKQPGEPVEADVFLLTDGAPSLLPAPEGLRAGALVPRAPGLRLARSEPASGTLLADLRADRGMGWVPDEMWLTYVRVDATAADLRYDLAIDATGSARPSFVAAGLSDGIARFTDLVRVGSGPPWIAMLGAGLALGAAVALGARRLVAGL